MFQEFLKVDEKMNFEKTSKGFGVLELQHFQQNQEMKKTYAKFVKTEMEHDDQ